MAVNGAGVGLPERAVTDHTAAGRLNHPDDNANVLPFDVDAIGEDGPNRLIHSSPAGCDAAVVPRTISASTPPATERNTRVAKDVIAYPLVVRAESLPRSMFNASSSRCSSKASRRHCMTARKYRRRGAGHQCRSQDQTRGLRKSRARKQPDENGCVAQ